MPQQLARIDVVVDVDGNVNVNEGIECLFMNLSKEHCPREPARRGPQKNTFTFTMPTPSTFTTTLTSTLAMMFPAPAWWDAG